MTRGVSDGRGLESRRSSAGYTAICSTGGHRKAGTAVKTKPSPLCEKCPPGRSDQMKTCSKCGQAKLAGEFYRDNGHRDGLSSACRPCMKAQAVAWQRANPQKAREMKARHAIKRRVQQRDPSPKGR